MQEPRRAIEPHRWKFIRTGGVDQVVIRSGADIVNLQHLDQKLWVALACPTRGLELDPRTRRSSLYPTPAMERSEMGERQKPALPT